MVHHGNASCEFVCDKGLMNKGLNDKDVCVGFLSCKLASCDKREKKNSELIFIVCFFSTEQIFDHVIVRLGLKQSDTNKRSYAPTVRSLLA